MSNSNNKTFEKAMKHILKWEIVGGENVDFDDERVRAGDISTPALRRMCGYTNHKDDKGGETKFGIAQKANPGVNVRALTFDQAKEIYRKNYWAPIRADEMPERVAIYVFDIAVNAGPARAIKMLQKAAGVAVDGVIGPKTLAAVKAVGPDKLLSNLVELRRQFYYGAVNRDASQRVFLAGWLNRTNDI